jgi:DNA-directed RNA polymerase specialized sigma24 family protein
VVAVTMEKLREDLARLDPTDRALLDLNLRRGMEESEIAEVLNVDAAEVSTRRERVLEKLASDLGLETREQHDELRATLPDLPPEYWKD